MQFTERELALLMIALDNTSNDLREHPARSAQTLLEAKDMCILWGRINEEREHQMREEVLHGAAVSNR